MHFPGPLHQHPYKMKNFSPLDIDICQDMQKSSYWELRIARLFNMYVFPIREAVRLVISSIDWYFKTWKNLAPFSQEDGLGQWLLRLCNVTSDGPTHQYRLDQCYDPRTCSCSVGLQPHFSLYCPGSNPRSWVGCIFGCTSSLLGPNP